MRLKCVWWLHGWIEIFRISNSIRLNCIDMLRGKRRTFGLEVTLSYFKLLQVIYFHVLFNFTFTWSYLKLLVLTLCYLSDTLSYFKLLQATSSSVLWRTFVLQVRCFPLDKYFHIFDSFLISITLCTRSISAWNVIIYSSVGRVVQCWINSPTRQKLLIH